MKLINHIPVLMSMTPEDFTFDYNATVPVISIICMVIGIILLIAVPVFIFIHMKNRFKLSLAALTIGLLSYLISLALMPTALGRLIMMIPAASDYFESHAVTEAIIYAVITSACGFAGMLIGMLLASRKNRAGFSTAVLFGVSFSLMPILAQGLSYLFSYFQASISINQGQLADSVASMIENGTSAEEIQSGLDSMTDFINTSAGYFLSFALDYILMLMMYLGICVILGSVFAKRSPKSGIAKAAAVQALYTVAFALRCSESISSPVVNELIYAAVAIISIAAAYLEIKKYMPDDLLKLMGPADPSLKNNLSSKKPDDKPHKMPKIVMPKD